MRWLTHSCAQNTNAAARGKLRIDICFLFLYDCLINLWGRCRRKFWYQDRQSTTSCERGKNEILLRAQPLLHLVATQQNKVFLLRSFWFYCRGFLVWLARPQARNSPKKARGQGAVKKRRLRRYWPRARRRRRAPLQARRRRFNKGLGGPDTPSDMACQGRAGLPDLHRRAPGLTGACP